MATMTGISLGNQFLSSANNNSNFLQSPHPKVGISPQLSHRYRRPPQRNSHCTPTTFLQAPPSPEEYNLPCSNKTYGVYLVPSTTHFQSNPILEEITSLYRLCENDVVLSGCNFLSWGGLFHLTIAGFVVPGKTLDPSTATLLDEYELLQQLHTTLQKTQVEFNSHRLKKGLKHSLFIRKNDYRKRNGNYNDQQPTIIFNDTKCQININSPFLLTLASALRDLDVYAKYPVDKIRGDGVHHHFTVSNADTVRQMEHFRDLVFGFSSSPNFGSPAFNNHRFTKFSKSHANVSHNDFEEEDEVDEMQVIAASARHQQISTPPPTRKDVEFDELIESSTKVRRNSTATRVTNNATTETAKMQRLKVLEEEMGKLNKRKSYSSNIYYRFPLIKEILSSDPKTTSKSPTDMINDTWVDYFEELKWELKVVSYEIGSDRKQRKESFESVPNMTYPLL
eukprot:Awhi_evm1s13007